MKKFGFTLAELLITLTIVGISAALVAPAVSDIMPDANKAKVIKYNVQLNNAMDTFFTDRVYCPSGISDGLACFKSDAKYSLFEDYLCDELGVDSDTYETPDGSFWNISGDVNNGYKVSIRIKPTKSNCSYRANCNTAKDIDTFVFKINADGNVLAGDPLTDAYLRNPLKMNDKKEDFATAKSFASKKY